MSDLTDSIARLQALRERIRKAEEAAAREEQLRRETEEAATKLVMENADIKHEVTKERQNLEECVKQYEQLDSQKGNIEKTLQVSS